MYKIDRRGGGGGGSKNRILGQTPYPLIDRGHTVILHNPDKNCNLSINLIRIQGYPQKMKFFDDPIKVKFGFVL